MRLLVGIIALCVASVVADLPSCTRARCVHCDVEFIYRMCPQACAACGVSSGTLQAININKPTGQFDGVRPAQPTVITQYIKNINTATQPLALQPARQAGVPTQTHGQQPVQQPYYYQPQAFAAPQAQVPAIQYPRDTSTLAPLIEQPHADSLNPGLGRQPADLAQPLPEYQQGANYQQHQAQNNYYQQQPQYNAGQYQQSQQNAFGQNNFAQPANNGFGTAQSGFGYQQQQGAAAQQNAFLNPFQPFLQNSFQAGGGGANALDPLGLFNLGSSNTFAQAAPLARVAQPAPQQQLPYGQQAAQAALPATQQPSQGSSTNFNGNYQQTAGTAQLQQQGNNYHHTPTTGNYQQPQQFQMQLPQLPNIQMPHVPPSPPAPVNLHQPLVHQQPQYQQQQSQQQQQQRPIQQEQPQQQYVQQNGQQQQPIQTQYTQQQQQQQQPQPLPQPQISTSIDAAPVNFQKYIDGGKPSAPPPVAQTCPRQPGWAPCITKDLANERFRNCCSRLGEGCTPLCNYDATLATMQLAVLTGRCPLNKVADMMICASGYEDATPCCEAYSVFEPGYEHCRPYCNPAAGLPQGGLLSEKYKCLVKLSAIQQCFYVTQKP